VSPRLFKTREGLAAFLASRPGKMLHISVQHDATCSPSICRCSPWFEVREATVEACLNGIEAQRVWTRETAS
jgi:hypothetical protein